MKFVVKFLTTGISTTNIFGMNDKIETKSVFGTCPNHFSPEEFLRDLNSTTRIQFDWYRLYLQSSLLTDIFLWEDLPENGLLCFESC